MKNKILAVILGILIIFILGIFVYRNFITGPIYTSECGNYSEQDIILGNKNLKTIIADDYCKLTLGLSGKTGLNADEGMLFAFDKPGNYGFWMKDMEFPLDILWISDSFSVVGVEKNLATDTYPTVFGENYEARYVLEVPAGFSDKNNIKVGDSMKFL